MRTPTPTRRARSLIFALTVAVLGFSTAGTADTAASLAPGTDFGAGLTLTETSDLASLLDDPARYANAPVLVYARIADVCQKKGCWTVLADGDATMRVRFKDYGFFLPKDSSGKHAYVEGILKIEAESSAEARHYASESQHGDSEAVHGQPREVGFTASGVRIVETR